MADPILDELEDMFPHEILVEKPNGEATPGGDVTYTGGINFKIQGRVTDRVRQVLNPEGQLIVSNQHVVLFGARGVTVKDRITLPEEFSPRKPKLLAVRRVADENGAHHEVVYF